MQRIVGERTQSLGTAVELAGAEPGGVGIISDAQGAVIARFQPLEIGTEMNLSGGGSGDALAPGLGEDLSESRGEETEVKRRRITVKDVAKKRNEIGEVPSGAVVKKLYKAFTKHAQQFHEASGWDVLIGVNQVSTSETQVHAPVVTAFPIGSKLENILYSDPVICNRRLELVSSSGGQPQSEENVPALLESLRNGTANHGTLTATAERLLQSHATDMLRAKRDPKHELHDAVKEVQFNNKTSTMGRRWGVGKLPRPSFYPDTASGKLPLWKDLEVQNLSKSKSMTMQFVAAAYKGMALDAFKQIAVDGSVWKLKQMKGK
jgi:hypothetical protein